MDSTPNLALPYIMPAQAQKHVTHNEALRALDAIVHLAVQDKDLSTPPASPAAGVRYIVGASPSGAWAGHANDIAAWQDEAWAFYTPVAGWLAWVHDESQLYLFSGGGWTAAPAGSGSALVPKGAWSVSETYSVGDLVEHEGYPFVSNIDSNVGNEPDDAPASTAAWTYFAIVVGSGGGGGGEGDGTFDSVGINATADATNRLAVASAASLFHHDGDDHRLKINKGSAGDTASLIFQSDFSGRAEFGLPGSDDFEVKVSADGASWHTALAVARQTGKISFPQTNVLTDFAVSLLPDSGRFAGNSARDIAVGAYVFPSYLTLYNGATSADGGKFIQNNNDYGGVGGALPAQVKALIDQIRGPATRRYGVEFRISQITMGAGVDGPLTVSAANYYLSLFLAFGPRVPAMTFHAYVRALDAPILYPRFAGQTIIKNGVRHETHVVIEPSEGWVSITAEDEQIPYNSAGYSPAPFNLYMRASGHRALVACPALMGGITRVDDNIGVIAGINRWLP